MKYLKIHLFIWYVLCFIITLIEFVIHLIACLVYFIWFFKNPFKDDEMKWHVNHNSELDIKYTYQTENDLKYKYVDKTPIDTFIRRCKFQIN